MKTKVFISGLAGAALSTSVFAGDNRYGIQLSPYDSSIGGSTEIEMRRKQDDNPFNKFRGEVESDGSIRMINVNGERLRGEIDSNGDGKLRDQEGNTYQIQPRQIYVNAQRYVPVDMAPGYQASQTLFSLSEIP